MATVLSSCMVMENFKLLLNIITKSDAESTLVFYTLKLAFGKQVELYISQASVLDVKQFVCTLKVVQLCGRSRVMRSATGSAELSLVVAAVVLPLPTSTELIIDSSAFVISLGIDLNVLHCDTRSVTSSSLTHLDIL